MTREELWNLEETQHLKKSWEDFALQQCEKLSNLEKQLEEHKQALQTISEWDQYTEDYYGGVSINWNQMCHDMIEFAKNFLNINKGNKNDACNKTLS